MLWCWAVTKRRHRLLRQPEHPGSRERRHWWSARTEAVGRDLASVGCGCFTVIGRHSSREAEREPGHAPVSGVGEVAVHESSETSRHIQAETDRTGLAVFDGSRGVGLEHISDRFDWNAHPVIGYVDPHDRAVGLGVGGCGDSDRPAAVADGVGDEVTKDLPGAERVGCHRERLGSQVYGDGRVVIP